MCFFFLHLQGLLPKVELEENETSVQYGLEPYVAALLDVTLLIAYKAK